MWYSIANYLINLSLIDTIEKVGKTISFYRVIPGEESSDYSYSKLSVKYLKVFSYTFDSEELAQKTFSNIQSRLISK